MFGLLPNIEKGFYSIVYEVIQKGNTRECAYLQKNRQHNRV